MTKDKSRKVMEPLKFIGRYDDIKIDTRKYTHFTEMKTVECT